MISKILCRKCNLTFSQWQDSLKTVLTVYIRYDRLRQSMPGESHEHLSSTLPPAHVVRGAPRGAGAEQQTQVVFSSQFLPWASVRTQTD